MKKVRYKNLWKKLIDIGMTQKELSEKSGVSISTICRMKSGDGSVGIKKLSKIAETVGCTIDEIVDDIDLKSER